MKASEARGMGRKNKERKIEAWWAVMKHEVFNTIRAAAEEDEVEIILDYILDPDMRKKMKLEMNSLGYIFEIIEVSGKNVKMEPKLRISWE